MNIRTFTVLSSLLFSLSACDSDPAGSTGTTASTDDGRGAAGKADVSGSCQSPEGELTCDGAGTGSCFCEWECVEYGDCCADAASLCGVDDVDDDEPDAGFYNGAGVTETIVLGGLSDLINDAADAFEEEGIDAGQAFILDAGQDWYAPDAEIFPSLIEAGILPPGEGPEFLATLLGGLAANDQTMRVLSVCDVVRFSDETPDGGPMSFGFTSISRRGGPDQPMLLFAERLEISSAGTAWSSSPQIDSHRFLLPEQPIAVDDCTLPEVHQARQQICEAFGVDCS